MRRILLFLPLLAALVLGIILFAGIGKDTQTLESALVGKPVPAFVLTDLHNPDIKLNQELFQGKVRLLNVWAT
ncbi:MAG TPA: DsbE family thiol:disulfide interchange protein, partial [Marinobacter sp.]|nr:DsbE family thiol:disulfide interchange protein [Marinobacter sp.]